MVSKIKVSSLNQTQKMDNSKKNNEESEVSREISDEIHDVTQKLAEKHRLDKEGVKRIFNEILNLQHFAEEGTRINF